MISGSRFAALVRERLPSSTAETWIRLLPPNMHLLLPAGPSDAIVGRLGGEPLLPDDTDWPRVSGSVPLAFVASLGCARLAGIDLPLPFPTDGTLLFFYLDGQAGRLTRGLPDPPEAEARVLYVPGESRTARRPTPAPLRPYRHLPLRSEPAVDIRPLYFSDELDALGHDPDTVLDALKDELFGGYRPGHQVFGYPHVIQGRPEYDIAREVVGEFLGDDDPLIEGEAARWELLAQFSDDVHNQGMEWGDGGVLYWHMTREDLADRRFDRAYFSMQTH